MRQPDSTPPTTEDTVYGVDGDICVTPTHRGTVQIIAGNEGDDWGVDIDIAPDDAERLADLIRTAAARARELEWEAQP